MHVHAVPTPRPQRPDVISPPLTWTQTRRGGETRHCIRLSNAAFSETPVSRLDVRCGRELQLDGLDLEVGLHVHAVAQRVEDDAVLLRVLEQPLGSLAP